MSTSDAERRSAYKAVAASSAWQAVLADLILFACSEKEPAVRCGRMDMVAYIEDALIGTPLDEGEGT